MANYKDLDALPTHMHGAILRYIEKGIPPGSFLMAVFGNELTEAYGRADFDNQRAMPEYAAYLYNNAPSACHGSPEIVEMWIAKGGLEGRENA